MPTEPMTTSVRDSVDELGHRLTRIGAAASSLGSLATEIRHGVPPADILVLLEQIDRDLKLAGHQLEIARARAQLEIDSLRRPDRTT